MTKLVWTVSSKVDDNTYLSDEALKRLSEEVEGKPIYLGKFEIGHVEYAGITEEGILVEGDVNLKLFPSFYVRESFYDGDGVRVITKADLKSVSLYAKGS